MDRREEQQLIARAKDGDTAAFAALVHAHGQLVYNLALRTLGDPQEAEDMAQEAFVRAWQSLDSFRGEARFSTWLYRIVTNLCYNRLPRLKRELEALDPDEDVLLPAQRPSVEKQLLNDQLRIHLWRAIEELPEQYRMLITLRHLQGMSYREIAEVTETPLGTVKTGIYRARRRLQEALTAYEEVKRE